MKQLESKYCSRMKEADAQPTVGKTNTETHTNKTNTWKLPKSKYKLSSIGNTNLAEVGMGLANVR